MKDSRNTKIKLITITLFLLNIPVVIFSQWRNIGPGGGSDLQSILIQPNNSDVVFIGGDIEGILKTTNGGKSWEMVNNNLALENWTPDVYWTNQFVYDFSDSSFNTIFLCSGMGLFKTTDGAKSWKELFPVTINSEDDFTGVYSVAQSPDNFNSLFIGTDKKGLFHSTDGGKSWNKIPLPISDSTAILKVIVTENSELALATTKGFLFSKDAGKSWEIRNNGLPNAYIWNLKYVKHSGGNLLFCTLATFGKNGNPNSFNGGIYRSTDMGLTWQNINGNLPVMQSDGLFYYYWKFAVNPFNPNTIYIGTSVGYPDESLAAYEDWGIYKTTNGGNYWVKTDDNLKQGWMDSIFFDERHALVLAIAESDTNIIYWGRDWMNKSTDGGNSWFQIYSEHINNAWKTNGIELMIAETIAFDSNNPQTFYVGYDDMGPFVTTDGGNSFNHLDKKMDPYDGYDAAKDILIDPQNHDIYISRYDGFGSADASGYSLGKIYLSTDGGKNFQEISNGFPDGRPALAIDFTDGNGGNRTLYACSYGNGVYKSTDSGKNWTAINNGLGSQAQFAWTLTINPENPDELFLGLNSMGAGGGIFKTTNGGTLWEKLNNFPLYDVLTIKIDTVKNIIYAGATENYDWSMTGGLFKSTNEGSSWIKISDFPRVADIDINPENPDNLFIAVQPWYSVWQPSIKPGVYESTDGGTSWLNISSALEHTFVTFVKINPANHSQLFAGTAGGGLWFNDALTNVKIHSNKTNDYFILTNYPNPFNPSTTIEYSIPEFNGGSESALQIVILKIYDVLGREIKTLVNKPQKPGRYSVEFNANNFSGGVYFCKLQFNNRTLVNKMLLLK